jgi:hypothetical protein
MRILTPLAARVITMATSCVDFVHIVIDINFNIEAVMVSPKIRFQQKHRTRTIKGEQ